MKRARPLAPSSQSSRVAGTAALRLSNREAVLKAIVLAKTTTRAELAQQTGLSIASITNIVGDLIGEGLVRESGSKASGGGRPVAIIEPDPHGAYVIGVDVGERGLAVEIFDFTMALVDREEREHRSAESLDQIRVDLASALDALQERQGSIWERAVGIGLALPGPVEFTDGGPMLFAQSLGWPEVLASDLVPSDLPVFADNGAKTLARAELWWGAASDVSHALVALVGRGVGMGVIVDGEVARGAFSTAGEWGHTKVQLGGRLCRCGARGCLEAYVGGDAVLASWSAAGGLAQGSAWDSLGDLLEHGEAGDTAATVVIDETLEMLGMSLGGMVNMFNPERIVLGGWVGARLLEHHRESLESRIRAHALSRPAVQFDLVPTKFGGDSVALGAALLPLEAVIAGSLAVPAAESEAAG